MTDDSDINRFAPPKAQIAEPGSLTDGPVLAGRGMRLLAAFLDGILISVVIWPLYFVFGGASLMTAAYVPGGAPPSPFSMMGAMFMALLPGYVVAGIVQGWSLHAFGGTLGKKLLGLRIVRTDGSRAGFVRLFFGRAGVAVVPAFVPLLGSLWALVDMLVIFRESRQCLHDQIADTIVVTAASSTNAAPAAAR